MRSALFSLNIHAARICCSPDLHRILGPQETASSCVRWPSTLSNIFRARAIAASHVAPDFSSSLHFTDNEATGWKRIRCILRNVMSQIKMVIFRRKFQSFRTNFVGWEWMLKWAELGSPFINDERRANVYFFCPKVNRCVCGKFIIYPLQLGALAIIFNYIRN